MTLLGQGLREGDILKKLGIEEEEAKDGKKVENEAKDGKKVEKDGEEPTISVQNPDPSSTIEVPDLGVMAKVTNAIHNKIGITKLNDGEEKEAEGDDEEEQEERAWIVPVTKCTPTKVMDILEVYGYKIVSHVVAFDSGHMWTMHKDAAQGFVTVRDQQK